MSRHGIGSGSGSGDTGTARFKVCHKGGKTVGTGGALGSDGSLAEPIDHWYRSFQGISIRSEGQNNGFQG